MAAVDAAGRWGRFNPVWVGAAEPAVIYDDRTLWVDTSSAAAVLKYRTGGAWQQLASGGAAGLDRAAVDARVVALVRPFARQAITGLDSLGAADAADQDHLLWFDASDSNEGKRISYGAFRARLADDEIADWAQEGNTDDIPANKLNNASGSGLDQSAVDARIADWAEDRQTQNRYPARSC